ncbi:MAG TPA: CBS domain-containing protein [Polyangia bacterium]|jgi:Mg/Co/Ni transporter MgtE (contains CBS domain)|nr:CBS domain-containing protein [Polyangia bacterium]
MTTKIPTAADEKAPAGGVLDFRFYYFSELFERRVRTSAGKKIGRVDDLVFAVKEPYPEAIGIFLDRGIGRPSEFVPWKHVQRIEPKAIVVAPPEQGERFPTFVDQPGWVLVDKHLMGRTILDIDGRRTEAVNDVQLLESNGRMVIVHVDTSFNGFLRSWGLGRLHVIKDRLISWKYVQPLNIEDAVATDKVSLSLKREQLADLPSEDLADALEELSGTEQQALFSALDDEKAAETLLDAEPRAQRQIIASMRKEKASSILSELSVPQLADLFSVLPQDRVLGLLELLPAEHAERVKAILSEREVTAGALMSGEYVAMGKDKKVGEALAELRRSGGEKHTISYVYVVDEGRKTLRGVVDLRELVLARDDARLGEIMIAPAISVDDTDPRDDLHPLFAKYHFRMLPVVDVKDNLLGVIRYGDVMKNFPVRGR